jgi:hypothetical protein
MLCQTGENSAFTRSQMIGFLPAGAIGVGDRIGDKRSCANTFGRLHKELESRNASAGTRFVTMPGSGLFRVTEEPIHRSPVIAAFGQVCLPNHPA